MNETRIMKELSSFPWFQHLTCLNSKTFSALKTTLIFAKSIQVLQYKFDQNHWIQIKDYFKFNLKLEPKPKVLLKHKTSMTTQVHAIYHST
jgi:hypothetical protein